MGRAARTVLSLGTVWCVSQASTHSCATLCPTGFCVSEAASGCLQLATELSTDTTPVEADLWKYVVVTVTFSSIHTLVAFYNELLTSSAQLSLFWDRHVTAYSIGSEDGADFYQGLWSLSLHNTVFSVADIADQRKAEDCPSGVDFCLSPASFLQTA